MRWSVTLPRMIGPLRVQESALSHADCCPSWDRKRAFGRALGALHLLNQARLVTAGKRMNMNILRWN
jgi:hypothetical protein